MASLTPSGSNKGNLGISSYALEVSCVTPTKPYMPAMRQPGIPKQHPSFVAET